MWPYGRVESQSPGQKTISSYLAKYLAKSFHLRQLYQEHGLKTNNRTYRFYQNLYQYEERAALLRGKSKIAASTGNFLNGKQTVFRHYNYATGLTSYFARTNKQLVGHCQKPVLIKKNYRLGTRNLKTLSLLKLARKNNQKEVLSLRPPKQTLTHDWQEFLITELLARCQAAEFIKLPLEQAQVGKEAGQCSGSIIHHFQTKPVLRFTFEPSQTPTVRQFIANLDDQAEQYDMSESKDFVFYPTE